MCLTQWPRLARATGRFQQQIRVMGTQPLAPVVPEERWYPSRTTPPLRSVASWTAMKVASAPSLRLSSMQQLAKARAARSAGPGGLFRREPRCLPRQFQVLGIGRFQEPPGRQGASPTRRVNGRDPFPCGGGGRERWQSGNSTIVRGALQRYVLSHLTSGHVDFRRLWNDLTATGAAVPPQRLGRKRLSRLPHQLILPPHETGEGTCPHSANTVFRRGWPPKYWPHLSPLWGSSSPRSLPPSLTQTVEVVTSTFPSVQGMTAD